MEKPKTAGKSPHMELLEEGQRYAWCSCGLSANQAWCNGAHTGSDFKPKVFEAKESKKAAICTCKLTKNPPFCDGAHQMT